MKTMPARDVPAAEVVMDGAEGVSIRWLIGPDDAPPNFHMRQFTLVAGGCTPRHEHPWEHEVYVLAGRGDVFCTDGDKHIAAGDFVYVPGGETHQFTNTGDGPFELLCLVPVSATA